MTHPKEANPSQPIHELIKARWSPYAFSEKAVSESDLRSLLEAARWTASSYNEQPWRYIVATKADAKEFERIHSCLVEGNQGWTKAVPVLALGVISENFTKNGKPNAAAEHDLGAASASLTFEATARGLHVHQMIGIVPEKAVELFGIPEGFRPMTALAIGYAADSAGLPDQLRDRETAPRTRRPLSEFVFHGSWGAASPLVK